MGGGRGGDTAIPPHRSVSGRKIRMLRRVEPEKVPWRGPVDIMQASQWSSACVDHV